ncbi:MAG TPA: cytochrome c3 family protein [Candidatus Dormibacteraeota bacterium]|nr:cytochrome c3 family protein [Candidatus Dormibacteraeota bacterium]
MCWARKIALIVLPGLCAFLLPAAPPLAAQTANHCLQCHSQLDAPVGVTRKEFSESIHAQKGLTCTSCHGGDASSDDMDTAMGKAAGFKGHIERAQIPALCSKCHSDAAYMRGYNPSLRTDQFSQYQTSVHGKLLARGDTRVAVCSDCHTAHDILPPNDPQSTVYPVNVAKTCANCHANPEHMKGYNIPTNQYALYSTSVHYNALMVQGDLSAPTCSTCHGSHGAAPPGVASVERVCSTCHVFQQQLFDSGPHKEGFAALGLSGCITCHTNHGIQHPSDAMIGTGKGAVCMKCHSAGEPAYAAAGAMHDGLQNLDQQIARSDEILTRAETSGVEVGEAKLALSEARDDLTKARVTIHSVQASAVDQNIQAGLQVTQKAYQAGLNALAELKHRREGLAASLAAIVLVLIGLALLIRKVDAQKSESLRR